MFFNFNHISANFCQFSVFAILAKELPEFFDKIKTAELTLKYDSVDAEGVPGHDLGEAD